MRLDTSVSLAVNYDFQMLELEFDITKKLKKNPPANYGLKTKM